ncbi:MAG: hypothetical protein Kow00129_16930 [Thermoleophilia bacterium]
MDRRRLPGLVLTIILVLSISTAASAQTSLPASPTGLATFESLGLTDPGGTSLLVTEAPGSPGFSDAVTRARQGARIVFAFGAWPEQLLAAVPHSPISVARADPGTVAQVVSYYATYPNRAPSVGALVLSGAHNPADLVGQLGEFLDRVDAMYRYKLDRGQELSPAEELRWNGQGIDVVREPAGIVQMSDFLSPDLLIAGDIDWLTVFYDAYGNIGPWGKLYSHFQAWNLRNDGSPYVYDYYIVKTSNQTSPGFTAYDTDWQIEEHTFKYQANGSGKTIIDTDPSTTEGSGTVGVSLAGDGSVVASWSYNVPDVAAYNLDSLPYYTKIKHGYQLNTNSSKYNTWTRPGFTEKVGQNSPFSVYEVGTVVWAIPHWYGTETETVNNIWNNTITFQKPSY